MKPAMARLPVAAVLAAAALSGCASLEPAYRRPPEPAPSAWPTGPAYGPAALGAPPTAWRDVFQDARLRAIIDLALSQNRDLRVAIAQIEASRAQYRVQRAAELPTVSAQATGTIDRSFAGVPSGPGGSAYANGHVYSVSAGVTSYELDLFGRVRSLTRAALEQYLATEAGRRSTQISLIAEVADDDLALAADMSQLAISNQTLASASASLDLAQRRLKGGIASRLDVANAATVVDQAKADIGRYTTLVAQDRNALNLVVGAPVPEDLLPTPGADPGASLAAVPEGLASDGLLRRPDVAQAEHQLEAAHADIGAARAAFFPKITLTGSGGTTTTSLASLFAPGSGVWSFGPSISLPIFDGGANTANLAYARAEKRIAVAQYEKAVQSAFREVADALADRGTINARLTAQQGLVDHANESVTLAQALYERGAGGYLDVLTARRTLYVAQQNQIATRLARSTNLVTLYKVLGGALADRAI